MILYRLFSLKRIKIMMHFCKLMIIHKNLRPDTNPNPLEWAKTQSISAPLPEVVKIEEQPQVNLAQAINHHIIWITNFLKSHNS